MRFVVSPASHHLKIRRELLAIIIRGILQVPQAFESMEGFGKSGVPAVLTFYLVAVD